MMTEKKTSSILVLEKAVAILKCFQKDTPELPIPQISEMLGIPKPTVHRILVTLERGKLVKKNPDTQAYRLGIGVLELASNLLRNTDIIAVAMPVLKQLARETGENCFLGVYDDGDAVNIHQEQGDNILASYNRIGLRLPAHLSALGKAILAYMDPEDVEKYIASAKFEKRTNNSIASEEQLRKELAKIRANGYAIDNEELEIGLKCVACPIFSFQGQVIASVSISGPANRLSDEAIEHLKNKTIAAAKQISSHLGCFS